MITLDDLAYQLDLENFDPETRPDRTAHDLLKEITFLAEERFWQYTPAQLRHFQTRLISWIGNDNFDLSAIRTLLELVPALQFVDRDDMSSLYRAAMRGPICRWIADDLGWTAEDLFSLPEATMRAAISETWFCPITDSMDIGQFLRVNQLGGASARPPWKVLAKFGNFDRVRALVKSKGYKRLVLLEDFVGSGTQVSSAIKLALEELPNTPVLFVPLVLSHQGVDKIQGFRRHDKFSFEAVFTIPRSMHLFKSAQPGEPPLFPKVRELGVATFPKVRKDNPGDNERPNSAFGYAGDYGLLFVQHTNCPNNTLPLIWREGPSWSGLFPRVSRG